MRVRFFDIHKQREDRLQLFLNNVVRFHPALKLFLHSFAFRLGSIENLIIRRRGCFSLKECHYIGAGTIGDCQVKRSVRIIVLLVSGFWVCAIKGLDHLKRGIVMRSIMKRKVSVVVLASRSLRKNSKEELLDVKRSLFPCSKMKSKIAVVIGYRCRFGISLEKSFRDLQRCTKRRRGMERKISAIILHLRFESSGCVRGARNSSLPTLC
mmetsp:Transcript_20816/g.49188  ORF Transcript_20816/g.49188 Transcript_20816/m.49188 type:complete len:210 (+) Transcript_20816:1492-2121(+)